MVHIKTQLIVATIALVLAGTAFGVSKVSAFAPFGNSDMVKIFAQKLGVSEDKVKQAFDEVRSEHQKQMQAGFEERLTQAVKDGKITDAQKQLIVSKHKELQAKREADRDGFGNLTASERRNKMGQEHDDLEDWAKQNNIDLSWMRFGFGMKGRHMMGR